VDLAERNVQIHGFPAASRTTYVSELTVPSLRFAALLLALAISPLAVRAQGAPGLPEADK
jgi:hypothetical protein